MIPKMYIIHVLTSCQFPLPDWNNDWNRARVPIIFSLSLRDKLYKFHPRGQSTINHFPTAAEQLTVIGLVDA